MTNRENIDNAQAVEIVEAAVANTSLVMLEAINSQRWGVAQDLRKLRKVQVHAPQLPEARAQSIYDQIITAEASVVGPTRTIARYDHGTAQHTDELLVQGQGIVLAEAQHATNPVRKTTQTREAADHGTGGLTLVLAERQSMLAIVPLGRQSGNANSDPKHVIKKEMVRQYDPGQHIGFLSLHGCYPGKVTSPSDLVEVHAIIGLGDRPNDASWEAAERIVSSAYSRYGLRVIIGNQQPHFNYAKNPTAGTDQFYDRLKTLDRTPEGALKPARLAAQTTASTTTFMADHTAQLAQASQNVHHFPSMQIELSRSLRLLPTDAYRREDPSAEYMGVYMGYCLGTLAAETYLGLELERSKSTVA